MTSASLSQLSQNALLAVLRDEDRLRLEPHTLAIEMPTAGILLHAGEDVVDTWFPCGSALAAFCR